MIRDAAPSNYAAIRQVVRHAFGQDDEANLVEQLRADGDVLAELVAASGIALQGHILYSPLAIERDGETLKAAALAPVSVLPAFQRRQCARERAQAPSRARSSRPARAAHAPPARDRIEDEARPRTPPISAPSPRRAGRALGQPLSRPKAVRPPKLTATTRRAPDHRAERSEGSHPHKHDNGAAARRSPNGTTSVLS